MSDNRRTEGMGMVFRALRKGSRKKHKQRDQESRPAPEQQHPYRLASYEHDAEGKRFKSSNVAYSFWSASKYIFTLSIILYWLPLFGPMIAGYVGGRRAGGPWKGIAAAVIPVVSLYCILTAFETGFFPSHVLGIAIAPAAIGVLLGNNSLLAPYVYFSSDYLGGFVSSLEGVSPYGINPYVLTVVFAYVGGIIAEQHRREIEFASGAVVSSTTVLVHDSGNKSHQLEDLPRPHPGVLASIASHMHLPGHDDQGLSAGYSSRRHIRDDWANAVEMKYPDQWYGRSPRSRNQEMEVYDEDYQDSRGGRDYPVSSNDGHRWKHRRRGRPNYAAKPRFSYGDYEREDGNRNSSYNGGTRVLKHQKGPAKFAISPNPKSIRRAQRMIDREWDGRHRYSSYSQLEGEERDGPPVVEAEAIVRHRREQHDNWDTI